MSIKPFCRWGVIAVLAIAGCKKNYQGNTGGVPDPRISYAKQYFTDSVARGDAGTAGAGNIRLTASKQLLWDQAFVVSGSSGDVVVCPVKFSKDLFIHPTFAGDKLFSLNDLNRMVFYRDAQNGYHAESWTLFPDSTFLQSDRSVFSGMYFREDWKGNSLGKYKQASTGQVLSYQGGTSSETMSTYNAKQADAAKETDLVISVCSSISGYNYSADNPDDTYEWSEPETCNNYYFPDPISNPRGGPGPLAPILRANTLSSFTIYVAGGKQPIKDITAYFGCFTISAAAGVSYSVQLCVDQPSPGTRQPWGWSTSGLGGSLVGNNPVNVGHTFLVLTENNNGTIITRSVGFYPTTYVAPLPLSASTTQGMLNDDETHGYDISMTISNLSSNQFQAILNYISLGNNQGFSYDLNSLNCTSFALNALATGDLSITTTKGVWPYGGGDDPGDLGEDIRSMLMGPNETKNTVSNPHPNTGNCQ